MLRDEITSTQEIRYPGFSESKVQGYKIYGKRCLGAELDILHEGQKTAKRACDMQDGMSPKWVLLNELSEAAYSGVALSFCISKYIDQVSAY